MCQFIKLFPIALMLTLVSCQEESFKLAKKQVTLMTKDSLSLDISPSEKGLSFESSNPLIADCIDGTVYSFVAGETQIRISSNNKTDAFCAVTVNPRFTLYREPFLQFGSGIDAVKQYERRSLFYEDSYDNQEAYYFSGDTSFLMQIAYVFEQSKLSLVYLLMPEREAEDVISHIEERFIFLDKDDDFMYYIHPVPPSLFDRDLYTLVSYYAHIEEYEGKQEVYIAVDYIPIRLANISNSHQEIKRAAKKYIQQHPEIRHKKIKALQK